MSMANKQKQQQGILHLLYTPFADTKNIKKLCYNKIAKHRLESRLSSHWRIFEQRTHTDKLMFFTSTRAREELNRNSAKHSLVLSTTFC